LDHFAQVGFTKAASCTATLELTVQQLPAAQQHLFPRSHVSVALCCQHSNLAQRNS
jgi:hypothetical protein